MTKKTLLSLVMFCTALLTKAQTDTAQLEQLRTESGVDPTRVQSRVSFFVFEPRPIFDFGNHTTDFILSPIVGKSLGGGFNLIGLLEIPLTNNFREVRGTLYQFGFNKNF